MSQTIEHRCDLLIIGSGAAGLSLALKMAEFCDVIVLSKSDINEGSTRYAQGGIAAVFDDTDSIDSHIKDTLNAGAGLCDEAVVAFTARNAKESMEWLITKGVPFDQEKSENGETKFHLTREGGHSHRRIFTLPMRQALQFKKHSLTMWLITQIFTCSNATTQLTL
jgi:L-aspartate oxidase